MLRVVGVAESGLDTLAELALEYGAIRLFVLECDGRSGQTLAGC